MKKVEYKNHIIRLDDEDLQLLYDYVWTFDSDQKKIRMYHNYNKKERAQLNLPPRSKIYFQNMILGLYDSKTVVLFINNDRLDFRRDNLIVETKHKHYLSNIVKVPMRRDNLYLYKAYTQNKKEIDDYLREHHPDLVPMPKLDYDRLIYSKCNRFFKPLDETTIFL